MTGDRSSLPRVQSALAVLRSRGMRVTPARVAVLEILDREPGHLNADEIVDRAARLTPGVHRATVYRALAQLGEHSLVTHTHVGGAATVYHLSLPEPPTDPHAHLQCTVCGSIFDAPVDALRPLVGQLERELQFRLEPQHTALLGTCARCR
ncbi:MAG TPA: Fur family transcriptional regulator [Propionibacteriaceae bacterium]|nr:Fur family transcriptional regulator [Propionibacteriaceae bacterium]